MDTAVSQAAKWLVSMVWLIAETYINFRTIYNREVRNRIANRMMFIA